jgi:peptidylprolyl isomerase
VPGDEQRHELVAQLAIGHRPAALVAGGEEHREHVVGLLARAAALVDQGEDQLVGAVAHVDEARPGRQRPEAAAEGRQQRQRRGAEVEQLLERDAQLVEPRAGREAEDRAQDDLERQRLRALVQDERLAGAPAVDLARGDLLHQSDERPHPLAVEGGQHELALRQVLAPVEQQHGARPDDVLEHARALAGVQHVGRRGEDLADLVGLGDEDPLALGRAQVDREAVAETAARVLHERDRAHDPAEHVERGRPGPGRQRRGGHPADRTPVLATLPRAVTHRTLLILLVLALALAGCGGDKGETAATPTPKATATPDNTDVTKKPTVTVPDELPPDTLQSEDIVKGTGPAAKKGDKVTVQYVGLTWSTSVEFDASWDRGQPFTFKLGEGKVIPGWDQGVPGMRKGGRRQLTIPADMAYGAQGSPPKIGPNECLRFIIDMVKIG